MSDLEAIKHEIINSLDIHSFYESYLGNISSYVGDWSKKLLCPFHGDTKTPNFCVNKRTGHFKCFACTASGSVFDFWIMKNGHSTEDKKMFSQAILELGSLAGVDVKRQTSDKYKERGGKPDQSSITKTTVVVERKTEINDSIHKPIPDKVVAGCQRALSGEGLVEFLISKRGLNKWAIEEYQIGFKDDWRYKNKKTGKYEMGRFVIPVINRRGECRNLRGYTNLCAPEYKMVNYVSKRGTINEVRYGSPIRLFNLDKMIKYNWQHVVICEGEFDAILLNQKFHELGMSEWGAVCSTHGAETFEHEFAEDMHGKYIYFIFDADNPGELAASSVCSKYFLNGLREGKFKGIKIITLPLDGTKEEKDITDYFLKMQKTMHELMEIINETPEIIAGGLENDEACNEAIKVDSLVDAILNREYIDKRIEVKIVITGTSTKVYHAIRKYEIEKCKLDKDSESICCCSGHGVKTLAYGHPLFIASCMSSEKKILSEISAVTCQKDAEPKIKIHEKVVMEQYTASQVVERITAIVNEDTDRLENNQDLISVPVYILQPKDKKVVKPTRYNTIGYVRTHPSTGIAVYFVESFEELEDDWSSFSVSDPVNKSALIELKKYSRDEIIKDIINNVTFIYEAEEILYTILLTYLSPLGFIFNGNPIRGWINSAIVGDSGTGKSRTYMRISDWLGIGNLFSALTGSRTGFLYSIKKSVHGNDWNISIGAYVRSNGTIIAVDEMQEMDRDDAKNMAISMETGKLTVERVSSATFSTQTRLILLLNPKNTRGEAATIADFTYGCESMKNCFTPMFIRRLDLAVFTTGNHNHDFYNKKNKVDAFKEEGVIKSYMMKALVYWAWTRKPSQIKWSDEATDACLEASTRMSNKFGFIDNIPLVNPMDFRENLARLSVAWAILSMSFSEDMESLIVLPEHVKKTALFIEVIYTSDSCSLDKCSDISKQRGILVGFEHIKEIVDETINTELDGSRLSRGISMFLCLLLNLERSDVIKKKDLADILCVSTSWLRPRLTALQSLDLITLERYGIKKTRKFNLFMARWKADPQVHEMIEKASRKMQEDSIRRMKEDQEYLEDDVVESREEEEYYGSDVMDMLSPE